MSQKVRALLVAKYSIVHQVKAFRQWAAEAKEQGDHISAKKWVGQADAYEQSYGVVAELYSAAVREAQAGT